MPVFLYTIYGTWLQTLGIFWIFEITPVDPHCQGRTRVVAASEESAAALNQVSTIIADLSVIATRINESMTRLNG